jgi:hypothetical protein
MGEVKKLLTDSWQRDLVDLMSASKTAIYFFKTAGFNRSHSSIFDYNLPSAFSQLAYLTRR